jgi:hypothetical protein
MANKDVQMDPVSSVTVTAMPRVPEFNGSDPEMWFAIVEAYFSSACVTSEQQRYLGVVAALPPHYANEVRDVIKRPMDSDSYATLKRELIRRVGSSQEEKTRQLLEQIVMEDEKPSQYLRRLQALAGPSVPSDLLRTLWMRGLPEKLKPTMATQTDKTLAEMAEVADTVYSLLPARATIHAVKQQEAVDDSLHGQMQKMALELAALKVQMSAIVSHVHEVSGAGTDRTQRPGRRRSSSRPRSRSRGP